MRPGWRTSRNSAASCSESRTPAGCKSAVDTIVSSVGRTDPAVPTDQVLVQQMVRGRGEALIGFRVDPDVGPIVLLAAGGVLAELHKDRSVRLAPSTPATAQEMIDEVTAFRALAGFRGLPKGDLAALRDAVVAMSRAAGLVDTGVVELEANPVMVLRGRPRRVRRRRRRPDCGRGYVP